MAYEKQTWTTGETITASKLNHMEDGIGAGGSGYDVVFNFRNVSNEANPTLAGSGASISDLINKLTALEPINMLITRYDATVAGSSITFAIRENINVSTVQLTTDNGVNGIKCYAPTSIGGGAVMTIDGENGASTVLIGGSYFTYTYDGTSKEYTFTYAGEPD